MSWKAADGAFGIRHPDRFYIDGTWVTPSTDRKIAAVNPATEAVEVRVAEAVAADMDRAVAAARKAFDQGPWPRLTPVERAAYLRRLAEGMRQRTTELGHAWTREMGVLFRTAKLAGAGFSQFVDQHADWATTFPWEERFPTTDGLGGEARLVQEPVGVVAAIIPWNAAFILALVKLTPALLAGCTVIVKASPEAALGPYLVAEVLDDIGLPPGVFNFLVADREASEHLVRNPDVDKVTFTGSTAAGRKIGAIMGERIGRYTLELGGKSPAIVLDDYDLEKVAETITQSTAYMTNQVCAALSRVIVDRSRHDQLAEALAASFRKIRVGDPYADDVDMGPLAMARQRERVERYIEIGKREARLVTGGGRPKHLSHGYYIEPTVFAGVDSRAVIAQEEIFGPVVCVMPADGEADAIRIANDTVYGLDGTVFTNDPKRAYAVARRVRSGTVGHNLHRMDFGVCFGGCKQSGVGREGGFGGLKSFMEPKTLMICE